MLGLLRQDHSEVKRNFEVAAARSEEAEKNTQTQIDKKISFTKNRQDKHLKLKLRKENNIKELNELQQKVFKTDESDLEDISITIAQLNENI